MAPGPIVFEIENETGQPGFIGISAIPAEDLPILEIPRLDFVSYLSGSRLLATQTFRDLFRSEAIRAGRGHRCAGHHAAFHRPEGLDRPI